MSSRTQILAKLSLVDRTALEALAEHGDLVSAAMQLGLPAKTLAGRMKRARDHFLGWWQQGETPVRSRRERRAEIRQRRAIEAARADDAVMRLLGLVQQRAVEHPGRRSA